MRREKKREKKEEEGGKRWGKEGRAEGKGREKGKKMLEKKEGRGEKWKTEELQEVKRGWKKRKYKRMEAETGGRGRGNKKEE